MSNVGGRFPMVVARDVLLFAPTESKETYASQLLNHDEINERSVREYQGEAPLNS
jgi:hypothetical protein